MDVTAYRFSESVSQREFAPHLSPQTWAIVVAGGDGVRLRPLVRRLFALASVLHEAPPAAPQVH